MLCLQRLLAAPPTTSQLLNVERNCAALFYNSYTRISCYLVELLLSVVAAELS